VNSVDRRFKKSSVVEGQCRLWVPAIWDQPKQVPGAFWDTLHKRALKLTTSEAEGHALDKFRRVHVQTE
jgi:hypothetical protein